MDLPDTFLYESWTIRYTLLNPGSPPDSTHSSLKTVVFVHGTPWSSVTFQHVAQALLAQGDHRILLYDLPGYGCSQAYANASATEPRKTNGFQGDTSVKFQALALSALLNHTGLRGKDGQVAPHVVAHDIAGTIALRCLLMHACHFQSLLLMDTNTVLPWGDGFYKLARAQPSVFCELPPKIHEAVVRAVVQSACYMPSKLLGGWEEALMKPWISPDQTPQSPQQRSFVRQIAQANDADIAEMLDQSLYSSVRCPTKILWGEKDEWIPKEKMDRLASMLKHCLKDFVTIPRAGHLIMIDQPERVTVEVMSWLLKQYAL